MSTMQSRINPFLEQILSTHHCSRGWAKGSSLSICFLISKYEPWQNHTYMCCFRIYFSLFSPKSNELVARHRLDVMHTLYKYSPATTSNGKQGRNRWTQSRSHKLKNIYLQQSSQSSLTLAVSSAPPISYLYLGHFPDGHDAIQCFLQPLIILLLCSSVEPNIHCMQ